MRQRLSFLSIFLPILLIIGLNLFKFNILNFSFDIPLVFAQDDGGGDGGDGGGDGGGTEGDSAPGGDETSSEDGGPTDEASPEESAPSDEGTPSEEAPSEGETGPTTETQTGPAEAPQSPYDSTADVAETQDAIDAAGTCGCSARDLGDAGTGVVSPSQPGDTVVEAGTLPDGVEPGESVFNYDTGQWETEGLSPEAPAEPGAPVDTNGDGISDGTAVDSNGDGNADGIDTNGDGIIDIPLPPPPPPAPPTPPASFHQNQPNPYCASPSNLAINLTWGQSPNATEYYVYYYDGAGGGVQGGWNVGNTTSVTLGPGHGLAPNHVYAFIILASNPYGQVYSDNSTWSVNMYGYTTAPDCEPPGAFSITAVTPSCPAAGAPGQIKLDWDNSSTATSYQVYDGDLSTGIVQAYTPQAPQAANPTQTMTGVAPNTNLIAGRPYAFLVGAIKGPFIAYSNNGAWSNTTPGFGPATFPDCTPPLVNLYLTSPNYNNGQSKPHTDWPPLAIKQNEQGVTLSWDTTGVPAGPNACTATLTSTANPPPPQSLVNLWNGPKPASGSLALPQIAGIGDYHFALSCNNQWLINTQNTITLIVNQLQKPFIQTTGGDVHTNESINIPQ